MADIERKSLYFFTKSDAKRSIMSNMKDSSLEKVKDYLRNGRTVVDEGSEVSLQDVYHEAAFPIELVRNNDKLRDNLRNQLKEGTKVYLYGESISLTEYEQLLDIENEITPPENEDELKENSTPTPKYYVESTQPFSVIGYTFEQVEHPLYLATILDENNTMIDPEDYMSLRAVVDHKIKSEKYISSQPLVKQNNASAAPVIQTSSPDINYYIYAGTSNILKGQINTDWVLKRETAETDGTYDYFGIEDNVEMTAHNAANLKSAVITHDLPFSADNIYDWSPEDESNTSEITVEAGYPSGFTLGYTFPVGGEIVVNEQGSQTNDYGKWSLTPAAFSFDTLPNPTRFKPSTTWFSTGTYAGIDLIHTLNVADTANNYSGTQTINVRYDY